MRDIWPDLTRWQNSDSIALATVIQTWGSSPRRAGSKMAFTTDGRITGSVSGGCVEAAVIDAGLQSLKTDRPQLLSFGVADDTAWNVGLACGGSIDIFVKPLQKKFWGEVRALLESEEAAVIITVVRGQDALLGREFLYLEGGRLTGTLGDRWNKIVSNLAEEVLTQAMPRRVQLDSEIEIFMEPLLPPPTLVLVGGVHTAVALVSFANKLGWRTIVIDPRLAWANEERFPHVDRLIQAWPEDAFAQLRVTRSTAIAMLTHDPKLDDPALKIALNSPAFYIGALGSKSTHQLRCERLLKDGVSKEQLSRIHSPIGLAIGAQTPEEIAMAIMAEVVDSRRKREQRPAAPEAHIILSS